MPPPRFFHLLCSPDMSEKCACADLPEECSPVALRVVTDGDAQSVESEHRSEAGLLVAFTPGPKATGDVAGKMRNLMIVVLNKLVEDEFLGAAQVDQLDQEQVSRHRGLGTGAQGDDPMTGNTIEIRAMPAVKVKGPYGY